MNEAVSDTSDQFSCLINLITIINALGMQVSVQVSRMSGHSTQTLFFGKYLLMWRLKIYFFFSNSHLMFPK